MYVCMYIQYNKRLCMHIIKLKIIITLQVAICFVVYKLLSMCVCMAVNTYILSYILCGDVCEWMRMSVAAAIIKLLL